MNNLNYNKIKIFIIESIIPNFKINEEYEVVIKQKLGSGSYGIVFDIDNNLVIKIFFNSLLGKTCFEEKECIIPYKNENRELAFYFKLIKESPLKHMEENIISPLVIGYLKSEYKYSNKEKDDIKKNSYFIIMPFCIPFNRLYNIKNNPLIDVEDALPFIYEFSKKVLKASLYMEKKYNLINLDIKLNNIMYLKDNSIYNFFKEKNINNNLINDNLTDNNLIDDNLTNNNLIDDNLTNNNLIDDNLTNNNLIDDNLTDNNLIDNNLTDNKKINKDKFHKNLMVLDFSLIKKNNEKRFFKIDEFDRKSGDFKYYLWPKENDDFFVNQIPSYSISINILELLLGKDKVTKLPNNILIKDYIKKISKKYKNTSNFLHKCLIDKSTTENSYLLIDNIIEDDVSLTHLFDPRKMII